MALGYWSKYECLNLVEGNQSEKLGMIGRRSGFLIYKKRTRIVLSICHPQDR